MGTMNSNVKVRAGTALDTGVSVSQISALLPLRRAEELAGALRHHAPSSGLMDAPVPGVKMFTATQPTPRAPCVYEPCVVVVLQGSKRGYFGSESFEFGGLSYAVFSIPLPMESEIISASPEAPFLGLSLTIEPAQIAELQMRIDDGDLLPAESANTIAVSSVDERMADAISRLIATFEDETDARILGPMISNEIFYRVLLGNQGSLLRAAAHRHGHFHRISQLLKMIQDDCSATFSTSDMARIASMSKTSLHESFKSITAMTPLQYLKSIRLHRARLLMLSEGMSASAAAYAVGYASASQFSREFKRLFGLSPRLETLREAEAALR